MTNLEVQKILTEHLNRYFSTSIKEASAEQLYKAVALVLRDMLLKKKSKFNEKVRDHKGKRLYYLCMEFLIGRSLKNNLYNLGLENVFRDALKGIVDLNALYELEADAGLGNGGLGRLASCFMDSLASCDYPATGFSILYEYGLFKQKIVDNTQIELPDIWLDSGEVWLMPRSDKNFKVKFGGYVEEKFENNRLVARHLDATIVEAQPYDMMISGADSEAVSVLRLWKSRSINNFDMKSFTQGDYMMATRADNEAELICKVLYPSDDHNQGKQLRLSQQYFLVSASLQNILKDHIKYYGNLNNLPDKVAIHINDTHPALAVPELMRLLVDEWNFEWDKAWDITTRTIAYTNHTVMAEALEKWGEDLIALRLPRIYSIIKEINRRFCEMAWSKCVGDWDKVDRMSIISHKTVRMANLSVIGSHSVNGVSALHSDIIKTSIFKDFNDLMPEKFTNVTNGIAHRRWLNQSNPRLAGLISELIGDGYKKNASELEKLMAYSADEKVLARIGEIKQANKVDYSNYVNQSTGFMINPHSRIDVQIKRLHEYKRQLMNVMKIVSLYTDLLANPDLDVTPQTFIFGAKAAGGYFHAKRVISLINCLSAEIQRNPKIKAKLDVLFLENYNVTKAEHLIPASEVSEQISLAGKEASGTSNMKFMLNGAVTLGTIDGANVEILESVGSSNIFTFGLTAEEVENMWRSGYYASEYFSSSQRLRAIIDCLKVGFDGQSFMDIANYLLIGHNIADPYMCQVDYKDYMRAYSDMDSAYSDKMRWNKMALVNIAKSGRFAADRSINDYAKNIWNLSQIK